METILVVIQKEIKGQTKLEYCSTSSIDAECKDRSILNPTPQCLPVQTSIVMNSTIPPVPSKAAVIAINDDDDEEQEIPYEEDIQTNQRIIISVDQFENIPLRSIEKSDENILMEVIYFEKMMEKKIVCLRFCSQTHLSIRKIKSIGLTMYLNVIHLPI